MSKLKESCKQPLPFTESYNTDIAFVTLKTRTSNELVVLEYDWRSSTAASSATQSSLSSSDCEKVLYPHFHVRIRSNTFGSIYPLK
jgi:hypothetical protein